ncbi:MAG: metallophosphoesterase [Bacteriovoracaceae bacterium]
MLPSNINFFTMKNIFSFCILIFIFEMSGCGIGEVYIRPATVVSVPIVSEDSIRHSVFLIGDAGQPAVDVREAVFRILTRTVSEQSEKKTIIFLGDNIYAKGLPSSDSPDRKEMERRIDEQIAIGTTSGAQTIFIPGNHDWEYQGQNGYKAILREGEYLRSKNLSNVSLLPHNGTPGPHVVDIETYLRIIAIDTQWWLHAYDKPLYPGDTSEAQTQRRWLDSLSAVLGSAGDRAVIVTAHHPLKTHGEHGGFFGWKDHLFPLRKLNSWLWIPLPGLGSLYPLSRLWGISDQDLSGRRNRVMTTAIDSVLSLHNPIAYAAGHEHTLQIIQKMASHYYLVSGNGIAKHDEALTYADETILASRKKGYMRLDLLTDGRVRLGVIVADSINSAEGYEVFSMMLR